MRAAGLRNKARARANETPEQAHERRESDLRNKATARANETPEHAHERRKANFLTRHRANQTQAKIQERKNGDSCSIPLYKQCHQANVCVCCDRFICRTDELHWIKKTTSFNKSQGLFYQIKNTNCSHVIQFLIQNLKDCYFHQEPDLQGIVVYLISPGCDPVMGDNRVKQ